MVIGLSDEEDDGGENDDLNVHNLIGTSQNDISEDINDPEIESILQDVEKEIEFGPELKPHVAESFLRTVNRPLTKETKSSLKEKVKIPANCKQFMPPKANQEIWRLLPQPAKMADLKNQQHQQILSHGLSILSSIANIVAENKDKIPKEVTSTVLQLAIDGSNIFGDQFQTVNGTRRFEMKRFLNPEYAGICNNKIPSGEYLFGTDLADILKSSKTTSAFMRNTVNRNSRYQPYMKAAVPRQAGSANLNWNRPFSYPNRGNGLNRFRQTFQANQPRFQSQNFSQPRFKRGQ
ncbi:hypothetical protein Fcan01_25158 [Folsomia candida]|uniref:Uncharacterized protein n=1 Tax=Folsomia candida TaxID=158441 RepID=A0A226D4Q5_FOLCA|nr:hypothetical protein Fcan01_25158 [Folsomia candida]